MENYGDVKFPRGTIGYESETGMYNWWYPGMNDPIEIPMDVTARHLHLWRNQDPYVVFAIPMCVFKPPALFDKKGRKQYVAVWFHKEVVDELINSETV